MTPQILRMGTGLASCAIALVVLSGAAARTDTAAGNGGTLVIGMSRGDADSLDPTQLTGFSSVEVLRSICDRLYDFNSHSQVVAELAAKLPKVSDHGLTYTIPLRHGIRFNDGTAFNAAAVRETLLRDMADTSARASDLTPIENVSTRGPYTVVIHLKSRFSALRATLATNDGVIMSPTQLAKRDTTFAADPVCVGPFMYDSRVIGSTITVVKSPYYYKRAKVHLDKIVFKNESNGAAAVAQLEAGDIQVLDSVTPSELSAVQQDKNLRLVKRYSLGWNGIVVNIGNKNGSQKPYVNVGTPLARSSLLRRAFEEAIDRKTLVRVVYQNAAVPDCTPVALVSRSYPKGIKCTPPNPADARKLVARSGYTNPTVHFLVSNSTVNLQLAQFIQAEETAVGINVVIDSTDNSTQLRAQAGGSFDTANGGWSGSPAVDRNIYQFLHTGGARNYGGYSNPRLDKILDKARRSVDKRTTKALYRQAFGIVIKARPLIFLEHPIIYAAFATNVKNLAFFSDVQLRAGFARYS